MNYEPTFLETDYAKAIQGLEVDLLHQPGWKELLLYRGISGFDAGYSNYYWKFLEILRQQNDPAWPTEITGNDDRAKVAQRITRIGKKLYRNEMSVREVIKVATERLRNGIVMQLQPKVLPQYSSPHKVLVLRSGKNTSPFPILKQLAEEVDWQVLFASWNPLLEQSVSRIGIPFLYLKDTYRRYYTKAKRQHSRIVQNLAKQVDTYLPVKLLSNKLGIDVQYDAGNLLIRNLVRIRTYTDIYINLLTSLRPDIVLLFNETWLPERLMALVARINNTPSVAIQHGMFIGHVYRDLAVDKMIVWGEIPRKFWLDMGCSPDRVISVGAFSHENWTSAGLIEISVNEDRKTRILVLGQNPDAFISKQTHNKTIEAIFQAAQALPEFDFVVRPHPSESIKPYLDALDKLPPKSNIQVKNAGSVADALQESDLVITVFSTAGVEAMLLEKPIIVLDLSNEPPLAPYKNAAELICAADLLPGAIRDILTKPTVRHKLVESGKKFTESYLGPRDGQAVTRAVKVIQGLS